MMSENIKIGWVVPRALPYSIVMASTRLRAYDVIGYLPKGKVKAGLYNPFCRYDVIVFQKAFNRRFLNLAKRLKNKGVKIVFDINVNYIDSDMVFVRRDQRQNIKEMLSIADAVIVPSPYLKDIYSSYTKNTFLIEEIIEEKFFEVEKKHSKKNSIKLLYCGYAAKADELYLIKDILKTLHKEYDIKLVLICDKDPKLDIIPYSFYKYNHKRLPQLLIKGDIKISPRDLSRKYNLGHTFTRIGYPMAVGVPVAASPLSSYVQSPAIICGGKKEWEDALVRLIESWQVRSKLAEQGIKYVKDNFSVNKIIGKYMDLFNWLVEK